MELAISSLVSSCFDFRVSNCGTPVISSDSPYNAAKIIVTTNKCGAVYDYRSVDDLSKQISNFIRDVNYYQQCVDNCNAIRDLYSDDVICQQGIREMKKLIGDSKITVNSD